MVFHFTNIESITTNSLLYIGIQLASQVRIPYLPSKSLQHLYIFHTTYALSMATSGLAIVNLSSHGCEKRNDLTQTLASRNNMTSKRSEPGVSSHLSATMSICMLEPHVRNAIIIREVLEQDEVNYKALVEVYVGQKSSYILLIKHAYQTRFRRLLDQDILNIEPKHSYQKVIIMCISHCNKTHLHRAFWMISYF